MGLYVFGTGGHAKVVAENFASASVAIDGFIDPLTERKEFYNRPVHACQSSLSGQHEFIVAIGNNQLRKKLFEAALGYGWIARSAIHPQALISKTANVAPGSYIGAGVIINAESTIGRNAIINTGAIVEHDCAIGDHVHLAPHVVLGGQCQVGEGALVGIGSVGRPGSKVGQWAVVGAGSVVIKDVGAGVTALGNPCAAVS